MACPPHNNGYAYAVRLVADGYWGDAPRDDSYEFARKVLAEAATVQAPSPLREDDVV